MIRNNKLQQLRMEAFQDFPAVSWRFESVKLTHQMELAKGFVEHWEEFWADGLDQISHNIGNFAKLIENLGDRDIDFISIKEQFDTSLLKFRDNVHKRYGHYSVVLRFSLF